MNPGYQHILVETRERVGLVRLNRPQRMNALNDALAIELKDALARVRRRSPASRAIVITGNDKAFAAGADIGAMAEWDYAEGLPRQLHHEGLGERPSHVRKPVIAAVAGYALGGGCELAMACDLIVAADTAKFGQPEITIGTMPGMGGTQRLPRAVGKAKAMDWCLTGPDDRRRRGRAKRARRARRRGRQARGGGARGRREDREASRCRWC